MKKLSHEEHQALFSILENKPFIHISRMSLILVLVSMLSGCCCLWYVDIDEPDIYSKQKSVVKTNTVLKPVPKEKSTREITK